MKVKSCKAADHAVMEMIQSGCDKSDQTKYRQRCSGGVAKPLLAAKGVILL
jgi:hypothetical protein